SSIQLENSHFQKNMRRFGRGFAEKRAAAVAELDIFEDLRDAGEAIRNRGLENLDAYLIKFEEMAASRGTTIHWAETAQDVNRIVIEIAQANGVKKIVKSKSMVSEESGLNDALAAVGLRPVGLSLDEAARRYLEAHPVPEVVEEPLHQLTGNERHIELAAIDARWAALEGELDAAQNEVDRSGAALQVAERSVEAFEGELSVRAGEDAQRIQRFAAAEQLRVQIDAVAGTLRRAEEEARESVDQAGHAVAAAESAFEQSASEISDLARRTRKLAEELPIDQRPEGDPLNSLLELADHLRAHGEVLRPEIDRAEAAVATAAVQLEEALAARQLAGNGGEGPLAEDLIEGLQKLLDEAGDTVLVLDEPFVGVDTAARDELLETVRSRSADHQVVLLTEDADVLGWAIELPIDEAAALPADALLARMRRTNSDAGQAAPASVDITAHASDPDPEPEPEPAPIARRWAGQR
ncbi:MAG: hypothetical protein ABL966_11690, partial [Acidimicrobiales bacterium]